MQKADLLVFYVVANLQSMQHDPYCSIPLNRHASKHCTYDCIWHSNVGFRLLLLVKYIKIPGKMLGRQLGVSFTLTGRSCFSVLVFPSFFVSPAMYVTWFVGLCTVDRRGAACMLCFSLPALWHHFTLYNLVALYDVLSVSCRCDTELASSLA